VASRPSLVGVLTAALASGGVAAAENVPDGPKGIGVPGVPHELAAVRVTSKPNLDGRLDDALWAQSPGVSAFTQQGPNGGAPPSEATTLRVLYDEDALYLGFDCAQTHTPVVGRLTRRDQDSESDWVWFNVDSRRDGRTAAFFAVNVAGVVADGISRDTPNGVTTSWEWDENWEAWTARTPNGWSAEIRIPLRILRFSSGLPVQSWGFAAQRFIAARQETDVWPFVPREAANPMEYFGRLSDLRDIKAREPLELRPFVLGQVRHLGADPTMSVSGFDEGASAGLDMKLHLGQSMTLDAAVRPDFAQVEADELTYNFINRYEIFYPEKRPLFLEGAEQFVTPLQLFYSRRIGASPVTPTLQTNNGQMEQLVSVPEAATIYGAAKLIGRLNDRWTVGTFSALTSRNDYQVVVKTDGGKTIQSRTAEPLTAFNVLRLRRDVGGGAQLGLLATATTRFEDADASVMRGCPSGVTTSPALPRCFRDAYVGGLDGLWRSPSGDYLASAQLVGGIVEHGQPEQQLDGTWIGSGSRGVGGWARLAKEGGSPLLADVTYTGIGRWLTFNDLGFMPRQNLHEVKAGVELRTLEPGPVTLERHLRLDVTTDRNLDGLDLGTLVELGATARLRNFWTLHLSAETSPARFDDREVGDGTALQRALFVGSKAEVATDPLRVWSFDVKGEVRFMASAFYVTGQSAITLRPLPQLELSLIPQATYSEGEPRFTWHSQASAFGRQRASSAGATLRTSYTFAPRLSLQTYTQLFLTAEHYDSFFAAPRGAGVRVRLADLTPYTGGPITDADYEEAALNMNVVLRWEYRLGSTLFLVYSRSQAPAVGLVPGEQAGLRVGDVTRVPAIDMLLVKLSFWWAT